MLRMLVLVINNVEYDYDLRTKFSWSMKKGNQGDGSGGNFVPLEPSPWLFEK
jgi:hypothetical protein